MQHSKRRYGPFKGANKRRELYLDRAERKRLVEVAPSDAQPFIKALCLLPFRPGELAGLEIRDLDRRTRSLTIGKDQNGNPRQITVPQLIADFFAEQVKGKLSASWVVWRTDFATHSTFSSLLRLGERLLRNLTKTVSKPYSKRVRSTLLLADLLEIQAL